MAEDTKKSLNAVRNRSFLNKDFSDFRAQLLDYAQTYFPDRIQDFSEASLGGLFLDLAAYVGDVSSFYLDHQFRELDPDTAVERDNIERMARNAGIKVTGAAPAATNVIFTVKVNSQQAGVKFQPAEFDLPIIKKTTTLATDGGVTFELTEDLDFSERDENNELIADVVVNEVNTDGTPRNYFVSRTGVCTSGDRVTESFDISDDYVPFRTITLSNIDVSEILDLRDSDGNIYYEVNSLTQDTVFSAIPNLEKDNKIVKNKIAIKSAPRRFIRESSTGTGLTSLRFGSGQAGTLDGDLIPDPSELALPLYGKKVFSSFTVDPNSLLRTKTLGISPRNTTLTVQYRSGGGLNHNISSESISGVAQLVATFPNSPTVADASAVKASLTVVNPAPASGGENALSIEQLRALIGSSRNAQSRIVTKQDLLARIYTMPSEFGRVFRVGVSDNPRNPLATTMYVINRDSSGKLTLSPDVLKKNLVSYLNEFRLISDAVDILDARIVNYGINFQIAADPSFNPSAVLNSCINKLTQYTRVTNFQIGEPLRLSDLTNIVYNTPGVLSVVDLKPVSLVGNQNNRVYSPVTHNMKVNTVKGMVFPPDGGIFELKFSEFDIKGAVV